MASERKYNIGDVVVVRYDMKPYHEFGEYNYPIGTPYIPGERLTIDRFQRGNEYGVAEKPIILRDNLIDHIETRENRSEPNIMEKGRYYKVTDTGVEKTPDGKTFTMIGKCLEEGGKEEDGMYRCEAAFITPTHKEINKRKSWCYKDRRIRTFEPASPREIRWVNHCLTNNKFISLLEFKELELKEVYNGNSKKFPSTGWCKNPSKKVIRHIVDKFNDKKMIRKGVSGIAWNGRSVWPIQGSSGYALFNNDDLEALLPKKIPFADPKGAICVDLETDSMDWTKLHKTQSEVRLFDPFAIDTDLSSTALQMHRHQRRYDEFVANHMALMGHMHCHDDEFTQQKPVVLKRKKKKRKLISC